LVPRHNTGDRGADPNSLKLPVSHGRSIMLLLAFWPRICACIRA
jgi:hypothetical protein